MPHPLQVTIAALRRRVRRLLLLYGISRWLTVAAAICAAAALVDFVLKHEERGIRFAASLTVLSLGVWAGYRYLLPPLTARFSDVFLARRIELRHPILHERLTGAVAFLNEPDDDPRAGSPALRRTVIHETTQDALRVPLVDVIRPQPVFAAVGLAALVVGAIALTATREPELTRIAALRLLRPWADDAWPRTNHLKFVDPVRRLALGRRFHAELVDAAGAEIPGEVQIWYRTGPDPDDVERRPMRLDGGVWTAERPNVERDFAYRAVGGDDRSMPWHEVQVVEPPALREVRWNVVYPEYAAWTPFDTGSQPADRRPLPPALPLGAKLEAWGRVTKPIRSALLRTESGLELPAVVDADRLGFALAAVAGNAWEPKKSDVFHFEFVGEDGFAGGDEVRQELRVEPDPAPWIRMQRPAGTPEDPRGDLFVTASAVVPVRWLAGDVFPVRPGTALEQVTLNFGRSDRSSDPDAGLVLYAGPRPLAPPQAPAPVDLKDEEQRTIDHAWNLAPLALPPGTFLTLYGTARDYAGQQRQSESRRLRVVSPDEFLERLNERQRTLHADLNKLRDKQEQAQHAAAAAAAKSRDPQAPADDVRREQTKALDLQREIAAALGLARHDSREPPPGGVRNRVSRMLDDLRANRVDDREVESRLSAIDAELAAAEKAGLPQAAADELAEAAKNDPADPAQRRPAADALDAAGKRQEAVRNVLENLLRNLAQWDGYGKFHEELNRLRREQEQLAVETTEHLQRRLKTPADDPKQAAARDAELAARQATLARRTDALEQQMRRGRDQGDDAAAGALERALQTAGREQPADAMRAAAQMLQENRSGGVPERQQAAIDKLRRVLDALSSSKVDELNRRVAELKQAEAELANLADEQRGLRKKLGDAAKTADPAARRQELQRLARAQRELQKKAEEMAERLRRLQARRSAERLDRSGRKMSAAGQGADQGDAPDADDQSQAAARDLDEARRELAEERRRAEADLAREAAAKLVDEIKGALIRQQHIVAETERYEALKQTGKLTRAAALGLLDLAREQESLAEEARATAERLASAAAFRLALDGAAGDMNRAAQLLRERRTDAGVLRAEQAAVRRYAQLLDALKPSSGQGPAGGGQEGGSGGQGGQQASNDDSVSAAELRLLKLMQEDLNVRTKELDELRRRGPLPLDRREEFERLGDEQGELADLLVELLGAAADGDGGSPSPERKPGDLESPGGKP